MSAYIPDLKQLCADINSLAEHIKIEPQNQAKKVANRGDRNSDSRKYAGR